MLAEPKISAMWLLSHPENDCVFFIHTKNIHPATLDSVLRSLMFQTPQAKNRRGSTAVYYTRCMRNNVEKL